ncbi:MAG: hypothetical protein P0Y66_22435 [Candidatus Kaistia colombiensis]|nr:MAG: hypothetical protein P0Y66_22435 [Kaistia sp.]
MTTAIEPSADEIDREGLVDRLSARVIKWRLNSDKARISVPLGEIRALFDAWDEARAAILAMDRRAEVVEQKFYHSGWPMVQLLEARHGGMVIDEGEAWFYSHTSKDGFGGEYDLLYRRTSPPAPAVTPQLSGNPGELPDQIVEPNKMVEPAPAVAVPENWKLVPVEPTEAMAIAGCEQDDPLGGLVDWRGGNTTTREVVSGVYRAMLAAAPEPPATRSGEPTAIKGIDSQVLVAARTLDDDQKRNPNWLWYADDARDVSFGRWHCYPLQAPYIRADLIPATRPEAEIRNEGIELAAKWHDNEADQIRAMTSLMCEDDHKLAMDKAEARHRLSATAIRALKEPGHDR